MTSGNIAVFDHDVRRYVDVVSRLARDGRIDAAGAGRLSERVVAALAGKHPGDIDIPEVLDLKRVIRRHGRLRTTRPSR